MSAAVKYTVADLERAGHWLSEVGMSPTVYYAEQLAQLIAELREECAAIADDIATGSSRIAVERAVGAVIAKRIREGRP